MKNVEIVGRAKGGVARAEQLSDTERREIAQKAAAARWGVEAEIAIRSSKITIGDINIPCAVMSDGTRLLSERAIIKAFGGKRGGSHWKRMKENPDGANLPIFLSAKNIIPFINKELIDGLERRRLYKPKKGGGAAHGIEATLLPKMCNVLLKVRDADASHPSQDPLIAQADIIVRGLAEVGIIALIDEATGYIDDKKKTIEELEEKKKLSELRNDSIFKQEKIIETKARELQQEIKKLLEGKSPSTTK